MEWKRNKIINVSKLLGLDAHEEFAKRIGEITMFVKKWMIQCDICGEKQDAKMMVGLNGEEEPVLPPQWENGYNMMDICPTCAKRLLGRTPEVEEDERG